MPPVRVPLPPPFSLPGAHPCARVSRRRFLGSSAAVGAGLTILPAGLVHGYAANERINVALVGVGGRGRWFVDTIPRMENVVAVCDVNDQKIDAAFQHWDEFGKKYAASEQTWERQAGQRVPAAPGEQAAEVLTTSARCSTRWKGIDAVVVATPDHTHAVVSAAAIRAGKHVFCEKPLTRTVHESRALRELARKHKVATSMGNQGTDSGAFRRALELIRDGTLGEIKEVHVWNGGGGADRKEPPKGTQPVPEYLKWDLWLGPAAVRPYHHEWMQRHLWREFGTCQLGNWASHTANLAFMALKVHELWLAEKPGRPRPVVRVEAESSSINRLSFPRWELIQWHIPARAEFAADQHHLVQRQVAGRRGILDRAIQGGPPKDKNNGASPAR